MKNKDLLKCILGYSLIIGVFLGSINLMKLDMNIKKMSVLEEDLKGIALQYHTVEGLYPSDEAYLKVHYTIPMDREKYNVYDDTFVFNKTPDIQVIKEEQH